MLIKSILTQEQTDQRIKESAERERLLEGWHFHGYPDWFLLFHSRRYCEDRKIEEEKYYICSAEEILSKINGFRRRNPYKEIEYIGKIRICRIVDKEDLCVKVFLSPEINRETCMRFEGRDTFYIYPFTHKIEEFTPAIEKAIMALLDPEISKGLFTYREGCEEDNKRFKKIVAERRLEEKRKREEANARDIHRIRY
jgi:hypothetical protein